MKKNMLLLGFVMFALVNCGGGGGSSSSTSTEVTPSASNDSKQEKVEYEELTLLVDVNSALAGFEAVAELAEEMLHIKINFEFRPPGVEGDNVVKTRLASGDMADLASYNSGSLLDALNPKSHFIDISKESFYKNLDDNFKKSVTVGDESYGIPFQPFSEAGAILYSKPIYKELGLTVPKTWNEFLANCEVIKESGKTAIYGTFAESWAAQVLYLGDHYNVVAGMPNFAEEFQAGRVKYETNPVGLRSWEKLEDTIPYYNEDKFAATFDDGCDAIASAEAAHWFMLTGALSNIFDLYGDAVNDIGVFGVPGDDPNNHGLTVWMPTALYGNKHSEKRDTIVKFMEFYTSHASIDAYSSVFRPVGPYCVKGYEAPSTAYDAVRLDMQPYFDQGKTALALEFETAVKGPNCSGICQELAIGGTTALEAARAYDQDCLKQALQLGLDWE